MRRIAAVLALAFGLTALGGLFGGTADAANTCAQTGAQAGCIGVAEKGYIIVADGKKGNPDPSDGYIGVTTGGMVACSDTGGPYTHEGAGTHSPQQCDPTD